MPILKASKNVGSVVKKEVLFNGMFSYVYVFAFNGSTEGARYSIHFEN